MYSPPKGWLHCRLQNSVAILFDWFPQNVLNLSINLFYLKHICFALKKKEKYHIWFNLIIILIWFFDFDNNIWQRCSYNCHWATETYKSFIYFERRWLHKMDNNNDPYKLRCTLPGHSKDVRCVSVGNLFNEECIVSGSRDRTAKLWTSEGYFFFYLLFIKIYLILLWVWFKIGVCV